MSKTKNIFVSHYHTDADKIENLKTILTKQGYMIKDSSIYEKKSPNNANNEEYIKSLIRPKIDWAGTEIVLIGKKTHESDYVNWEIEHAAREGKRIVGVFLQGETDSKLPDAFVKHGDSLQKWDGKSIINAINGDDSWNGPSRTWSSERATC
ncbi:MAG: TIR domain-containing protein [Lachnospiraceae bacterium]|nr:TIR domain-containing protein [Lachnospiraceae bacterium]